MNRLTIGSIVTATLLLVGCGGGGGSSTTTSSLTDSSTPTESVAQKIGKGYYVDSAVEGVDYQCGNESGATDENGTFTFESGSDCSFTLGGLHLRDINSSLLEDNITIVETNETVAQLLQTLDSDGNASNGIQIPQGADSVLQETLPSLDDLNQDLLEVVYDRLRTESNEYNGTVVDRDQTVEHLNRTMADLEERNIRTHLDVEAEQDDNGTAQEDGSMTGSINSNNIEDTMSEYSGLNRDDDDDNNSSHNSITNSLGDMMGGGEDSDSNSSSTQNNPSMPSIDNAISNMGNHDSSDSQEQDDSNSSSTQSDSSMPSIDDAFSNMGNNNSSDSQEEEHSGSGSTSTQNGNGQGSSSSSSNSSGSSSNTSPVGGMTNM